LRTNVGKLGEISVTNDDKYDLILIKVWRKVKHLRRGVLHETIMSLVPEEYSRDICAAFDIKASAKPNEDLQTLDRIKIFHEVLNIFDPGKFRNNDFIYGGLKQMVGIGIDINGLIIKLIIGIALIVIALYIIDRFWKQSNRGTQSVQQPVILTPKGNAILCLVVPSNRIDSELRDLLFSSSVQELTDEYAKSLLDKSVYFLACNESNLNRYVRGLNFMQDSISITEDGDIYIELFLPEGEDTIGKDIKRSLSRNLPNNAITQRVELLADLDNIDEFHRA
jgi:hypothetical protein